MRDTIEIDGLTFGVTLEPDTDAGFPWDNISTFGAGTHWQRRSEAPGERVLDTNRGNDKRFYDFAGAIAQARRVGIPAPLRSRQSSKSSRTSRRGATTAGHTWALS